jgi:hypothetical protein
MKTGKGRIADKAESLIEKFKNSSGVSKETPHLDAYITCEKLITKNWKTKWADWFYDVGEERNWSDKDYREVADYIKKKYSSELSELKYLFIS